MCVSNKQEELYQSLFKFSKIFVFPLLLLLLKYIHVSTALAACTILKFICRLMYTT